MTRAFVIMTAMPPTKGHVALIDYARQLTPFGVTIIVGTQPGEPWFKERAMAIAEHYKTAYDVEVVHFHQTVQQEPNGENDYRFWAEWANIFYAYGFRAGDYIVASESYGNDLARVLNGVYMPFDPYREIHTIKATNVRKYPVTLFSDILHEFQPNLIRTVTLFGADSTGKTTLAKGLELWCDGHFLFEWARPYLETVEHEVTLNSMNAIWKGQRALQDYGKTLRDMPFVYQDTDLFSTVGYWKFWQPETLPVGLVNDAIMRKSDLYLITKSNIPYEPDPIRYGVTKRESTDQYWIDLAEEYGLNYRVLESEGHMDRLDEAGKLAEDLFLENVNLSYQREGKEYQ